jgi:hypothetical protein
MIIDWTSLGAAGLAFLLALSVQLLVQALIILASVIFHS